MNILVLGYLHKCYWVVKFYLHIYVVDYVVFKGNNRNNRRSAKKGTSRTC